MTTTSVWYSSVSMMNKLSYKMGVTKREVTPEEMTDLGAGPFMFRLHLLPDSKTKT